ncbi:unnamed protein product [Dibothriocephalus latus]|uniref:Uncharacterized protein n=1 Tax=Dibothriocephalus latus TaxID=60516 RepID=A0A3P7NPH0_DIBLA|nr:unnamed protein product [Dibothriocephalus latus]
MTSANCPSKRDSADPTCAGSTLTQVMAPASLSSTLDAVGTRTILITRRIVWERAAVQVWFVFLHAICMNKLYVTQKIGGHLSEETRASMCLSKVVRSRFRR